VNFENQIADDDVNRAYSKFETSFIEIIDKHIPIKKRKPVAYPVPYMNLNLRNAIYKKKMYHNKFLKQKTVKNWEAYRKQRNLVTKFRICYWLPLFYWYMFINYFYKRCFKL
jgi:hypothetical protein